MLQDKPFLRIDEKNIIRKSDIIRVEIAEADSYLSRPKEVHIYTRDFWGGEGYGATSHYIRLSYDSPQAQAFLAWIACQTEVLLCPDEQPKSPRLCGVCLEDLGDQERKDHICPETMSTREFYDRLLLVIDEAERAINQPAAKRVLSRQVLNILTASLHQNRQSIEEQRNQELDQEADLEDHNPEGELSYSDTHPEHERIDDEPELDPFNDRF